MADTVPVSDIAIIGYHGRFPGADNPGQFWQNLAQGVDCIQRFSEAELRDNGVADDTIADPRYVPAAAVLKDVECFDAAFFGIAPRDAELMDPQQRLLLEVGWAAGSATISGF
jgi:acyl transferase domain-containing protein